MHRANSRGQNRCNNTLPADEMEGTESDAHRAFSRIQSLLDLPDQYGESSSLLDTPVHGSKSHFSSSSVFATPATSTWNRSNTPGTGTGLGADNSLIVPHTFAGTTNNEEYFERSLHPDEQIFHEILQQTMREQNTGDFVAVTGTPAPDSAAQADIAARYAYAAQERFVERAQEYRRYSAGLDFGAMSKVGFAGQGDRKAAVLQKAVQDQRAERDLWSLLEALTSANLMHDIDESSCEELLQKAVSGLPITASIPDYLQAAFTADERLRKGAVLKEWIEKASLDLVTEARPPRGEPWAETLNRVLRNRHGAGRGGSAGAGLVQFMHPDAQIAHDGGLLALDGVDRLDQESLLKSIWQLVRCGLIGRAQELAAEHRLYWLAASLQGVATHSTKVVTLSGEGAGREGGAMETDAGAGEHVVAVARVGNVRQPVWLRTCWLYASKLAGHADSQNSQTHLGAAAAHKGGLSGSQARGLQREDSLAGVLEMSIYAALCNHTRVLLASPLLPAWQDKVWALLKAAHERDIARVVHLYRSAKASHSRHYSGCDQATVSTELELFSLAKAEVGHLSTANCVQIFNKVPPPAGGRTAEFYLLNLQAAVMEGRSGIQHYVETTLTDFLHSDDSSSAAFSGREQVLRVFCHFCIWLKYGHSDRAALPELVPLDTMYLAVERYVDLLIANKQRSLVAAYVAFLSRPRRIHKYALLLRSMQTAPAIKPSAEGGLFPGAGAGQSADATEVLQLANTFFPEDVMDITRGVVEGAHAPAPAAARALTLSTAKRTPGHSRAPPLQSITSPTGLLGSPAGRPTVRFALDAGEVAEDGASSAALSEATPKRYGVRHRTATPRPIKGTPGTAQTPGSLSATPQVGSALQVLAEEGALHTRLRAADPSGGVSAEDLQQLESLRWLCFDRSHRVEAVKQANRFAVSYLLHRDGMKLPQLRLLLANYLPVDSVSVGDALLAQRGEAVVDVEQRYMHEIGATAADLLPTPQREHLASLREELSIDSNLWDAQVCKLRLWEQFSSAAQDVDAFHRAVSEFQTDSSRLLAGPAAGPSALARHRSKVARTAAAATEALLRAITCAGSDADGTRNPADGFKDIWARNEAACGDNVVHTVALVTQEILALTEALAEDDQVCPAGWRQVGAAVSELWAVAQEVYPLTGGEGEEPVSEHRVRAAVAQLEAVELPLPASDMDVEDAAGTAGLSDTALSLVTALGQCKLYLVDVRDGKRLAGALLYQMLTSYVQVCMGAAAVLSALSHSREAAGWYARAMQLADLVATEDHALQLYTLLHREDLKALLLGINAAALALLAIDPEMSIS